MYLFRGKVASAQLCLSKHTICIRARRVSCLRLTRRFLVFISRQIAKPVADGISEFPLLPINQACEVRKEREIPLANNTLKPAGLGRRVL